ncbi:imm11 family protein [Bradyrhizobium sp. 5.13L]
MSDGKAISVARQPRARKRRFYKISPNNGGGSGFSVADESVLPPYRVSRLPASTPPVPCIFNKSDGSPPYDLELCFRWWLISDRAKAVFERIDPEAFVFVPCDVRVRQGSYRGPNYWLCDVVRVLDALDEAKSSVRIGVRDDVRYIDHGQKYYELISDYKLVFREAAIGNAHIFRMAYKCLTVICDQEFKDACKSAGLKRIKIDDVSKSPFRLSPSREMKSVRW